MSAVVLMNSLKWPLRNRNMTLTSALLIGLFRGTRARSGSRIEKAGALLLLPEKVLTSLVLLGTLKNYGLAGGLALALFSKKTSVPATVSAVFMIVYIIWLELKLKGNH